MRKALCLGPSVAVISVTALLSPTVMGLLTRDLPQVREGQVWRLVTPVLVQSSGWGQLVFNLLGLALVGAALERRVARVTWAIVYVAGGVGSLLVLSVLRPAGTGGGSSDAIAALIGALALLVAVGGPSATRHWPAQVYSVFFVSYLTALALGGVIVSAILGDASVIVLFSARRALRPATVTRAVLIVVAAGVLMTFAREGHGTGTVAGIMIAGVVLMRRRVATVA